jgi:CheY-like chemotaxis protein
MAKEGQGNKILVADDEPEVIDLVRIMLEREGHTIVGASNGEQALSLARTDQPDLILLDVLMPKMSGLEVLKHLQADPATAAIPVIVLSVVTTHPEVQSAVHRGAVAYLTKPFELREMVRLVASILEMDATQRAAMQQHTLQRMGRLW